MCVQAALVAATTAISFMTAEDEYQQRAAAWKQNYVNSLSSGREEQQQLQIRMMQEQDARTQQDHLNKIEGAEIAAEAEVSAAGAGVAGVSLDNILSGINRKIGMKQAASETNHLNTVAQLGQSLKHTNTNIQNRINAVQKPTSPNMLGYALQGVGGVLKTLDGNGKPT